MKIFTIFLTGLVAFTVWIVATTPNGLAIKHCLRTSMNKVWLCDKSPNYVPLNQISPIFRSVVVASEDANFYHHHGFDWTQMHDSFDEDLQLHRIVRGGSTISQQLAKNVFLNANRTIVRKLREALLTVQIEGLLTKEKILEKYLNVIQFGPDIFGVKAAAKYYFNTTPDKLDLLQSAYLAYLIPDPVGYSATFRHKKLTAYAKSRILELSLVMFKTNQISADDYALAKSEVDAFPWTNSLATTATLNNKSTVNTGGGQIGEHNPEKNQVHHIN